VTNQKLRFESEVLPYLDAAYNLARWLVRDEHLAEDLVQDACLRAFRYFDGFRGGDARPWLLGIVRNVCYTWFRQHKRGLELTSIDDDSEFDMPSLDEQGRVQTPETLLTRKLERAQISAAIADLPVPFREVLVLREIEDMAYEDIAQVLQIPKGTVMSRLSRARRLLRESLSHDQ
jgi:RNA polymerase sigma-70 factor (ECF subfamily)